jgi:hypothetical protein
MAVSPHYSELLRLLNEIEAEYLIIGGYAMMKYTRGACRFRSAAPFGRDYA